MINYDANLSKRMSNIVRSYNRKISNLNLKGNLRTPKRITIKDLKEQYYTRKDLIHKLNEMEKWTERGSENLTKVGNRWYTQFEIDLFRQRLKTERALLNKELEVSANVTKDEYSKQLLNKVERYSQDWQTLMSNRKTYEQIMFHRENINQTMDSYLTALFTDFYSFDYPQERIDKMTKELKKLTPRQLQLMLETEPLAKSVFDYYHALTREQKMSKKAMSNVRESFDAFYENIEYLVKKYKS